MRLLGEVPNCGGVAFQLAREEGTGWVGPCALAWLHTHAWVGDWVAAKEGLVVCLYVQRYVDRP